MQRQANVASQPHRTKQAVTANQLNRLQKIQNAAARIVTGTKSRKHISPVLRSLHWLSVTKRIEYKILCLTYYQCLYKTAPQYLQELVSQYCPPCFLRSSSLCRLNISEFSENRNKKRSAARSFHNAAPILWNRLPNFLSAAAEITFVFNFVVP